jgi:2-haloalkanoic acid dehalogenase type II
MLAGLRMTFQGEVAGQEMTRWPDQLDFSAELSKARAAQPDAIFAFYPGGAGVQFVTQYAQSGLKGQIPLYTVFTIDELSIPRPPDLVTVADAFAELPLADGAEEAVRALHAHGLVTGVLTNASTRTMDAALARHELPLHTCLSVDAARRFKPHPSVYQLAVDATGLPPSRIGFVTANGWDAAGAGTFGFRVAWLRPSPTASMPSVGAPLPTFATWPELPRIFVG